jgi:hypothetical protein
MSPMQSFTNMLTFRIFNEVRIRYLAQHRGLELVNRCRSDELFAQAKGISPSPSRRDDSRRKPGNDPAYLADVFRGLLNVENIMFARLLSLSLTGPNAKQFHLCLNSSNRLYTVCSSCARSGFQDTALTSCIVF